jgi:octopine/nopaline transport system substrate-binding protein
MQMRKIFGLIAAAAMAVSAPALAQEDTLRVVTEGGFKPWNYTQPSGEVVGFDIDFIKAVCKELDVKCVIESQTYDAMIPALNDGKYDLAINAFGITPARMEVIDFTVPYAGLCYSFATVTPAVKEALPFEDRIVVLNDDNLKEVMAMYEKAFEGATIATLSSGTSTRFINKNLPDVSTHVYKDAAARDLDLRAGRVDVAFASKDNMLAVKRDSVESLELIGPCLRGDLIGSGGVGIGLKKGNTELKAKLDPVIQKLVENGTVKELSEKHMGIDMSPVGLN